jgi:hypothetical protein
VLQAVTEEWMPLADCTLIARGGMQFDVCKIYLARHSRVLGCESQLFTGLLHAGRSLESSPPLQS